MTNGFAKKRGSAKSTISKKERGRDAITGRFITVNEAKRRKKTAIVETIKKKKK